MPSTNGTPASLPSMTPDQKHAFARSFAVHVGVDTGKLFHVMVARGPDGTRRKGVRVDVGRPGFDAADEYLTTTFPDVPRERMLVGLEFAGHQGFTFAHFLARRGYKVVSVLPAVTKALKKVEDNSPQKDDAKDAAQICSTVGQGYYVAFPLLDDRGAELRLLATERHRLGVEAVRLRNRLHAALDLGWPEFGGQFSELDKVTPLALLDRWPTATDLAEAPPQAVHALVKRASRNHISPERIRALITSAHETVALTEGSPARRAEIERLLHRWALVREHIATVEGRLEELVEAHPAARALATVPEVGVVCAATLVAELGDPAWYEAPRQVVKLAGMTLANQRSGTSVHSRTRQTKHGRPLLRRQLFLLASRWCSGRGLYLQEYLALRRGGKPTTVAICAIARKLVPLLFMVMRTEQPFDLARWQRNRLGTARAGATATGTPYRRS